MVDAAAYLAATEPHGMWFGLVGLVLIIVFLGVLTVLYSKKAGGWLGSVGCWDAAALSRRRPAPLHLQPARLHVGLRQNRLPLNRALKNETHFPKAAKPRGLFYWPSQVLNTGSAASRLARRS